MNTENKIQPTHLERENDEIKKYLDLIQEKGYGHTIEEQGKRVRAGIAIAHHIHRKEIYNFYPMLELLKEFEQAHPLGSMNIIALQEKAKAAIQAAEQTS